MTKAIVKTKGKAQNVPKPNNISQRYLAFAEFVLHGKTSREAYQLAGFDCKKESTIDSAASRLLRNVKVQEYLAKRQLEIETKLQQVTNITKQQIVDELIAVGFSKITDFLTFDGKGVTMKDSDTIDASKIGAIQSVESVTRSTVTENGPEILTTQTKFRIHPKTEALIKLGEALGYFKQSTNGPTQNNYQFNIHVIGTRNRV